MRLPILAATLLVILACSDKTPTSLELSAPPTFFSTSTEFVVTASALNQAGQPLPETKPTLSVEPADVAVLTQSGSLRCVKSGEAVLKAVAGSVSREQKVNCRLVTMLKAPKMLRLLVGDKPQKLNIEALDANLQHIAEAPIQIESSDPGVVAVHGTQVAAVSVGTASLSIGAGDQKASIPVLTLREIIAKPLLLNDGARINQPLSKGTYELSVKVTGGDVTLQWVGGEGCTGSAKATTILRRCTLPASGAFIIENPSIFGLGSAADGIYSVYEVPGSYDRSMFAGVNE